MKKIDTVIRPVLWNDTRAELEALGVTATLREVKTFGRAPGRREVYRGSVYVQDTRTELELSVLVQDEMFESTLAALERATGDAEILVTSVEQVVRGAQAQRGRQVAVLRAANAERAAVAPAFVAAARA